MSNSCDGSDGAARVDPKVSNRMEIILTQEAETEKRNLKLTAFKTLIINRFCTVEGGKYNLFM